MKTTHWLIAILVLAAALRLYGLERGDPMNDEVAYAFRAIGLVDSFNDPSVQATTWEWLDPEIPAWARLSFHDHPPLVIWIQHVAMRLFGETPWAYRLPSAIFGIGSVALLYLIGKRLYGPRIGAIGALLFAVTINSVYLSRVGLQEAILLPLLLFAIYFFLRALERPRWFIAAGAAAGIALLAKYTAVILIPLFLSYLVAYRRDAFRNPHLWGGVLLLLLVTSPVIAYNIMLYRAVGHFDLQLSYLFGGLPEAWAHTPGKDIGSLGHRLSIFLPRLTANHSWTFLALAGTAALAFIVALIRSPKEAIRRHAFLALAIGSIVAFLLAAGPALRFLTILTPFLAMAAALLLDAAWVRIRLLGRAAASAGITGFALLLTFEAAYAWNNQVAYYPIGPRPWLSSALRFENFNWGHNELERWLERELAGKFPALTFEPRYRFVRELQSVRLEEAKARGGEPYAALLVVHGNLDRAPELWIFHRRLMYDAWPVMTFDEFRGTFGAKGPTAWRQAGFTRLYAIAQTNIVAEPEFRALVRGIEPIIITNPRGDEAFRVYLLRSQSPGAPAVPPKGGTDF